jgi:protein-L-isoaspartate(D-aspartate) O-methyltransferase
MMTLTVDPAPIEASRDAMRHAMVASQLRTNAVSDVRVVEAMARLHREDFLPPEHRAIAYRDTLLPLAGGRRQNSPLATARLITEAQVSSSDHVLLVGAAGGYAAAVLAQLGGAVVALEEDATLAGLARAALAGLDKVTVVEGPFAAGWPADAPYDVLVIDGAVEQVPDALIAQVKPGGRVVAGVLDQGITRLAAGRRSEGGFGLMDFADLECAILPGFGRPNSFQF